LLNTSRKYYYISHAAIDALQITDCYRHSTRRQFMNYATALELPSWTTEVQSYSQQVIRYTPVVLKAFSRTIAPVIIVSVKSFSSHWFESECYWRERITNLIGITHNPLTAAISAAHAELTSSEAQATYRHIRSITRETAMDALVIGLCGVVAVSQGVEAAQKIYRSVKRCYDWVDARLNPAQPEPMTLPTVDLCLAQIVAEEELTAYIKDIGHERSFLAQLDRLDAEALATVQAKVDQAIAQVVQAKANQLKCDRAALVLQMECDRSAQEAFAYVVDQAVAFAKAETVQVVAAPVIVEDHPATVLKAPHLSGAEAELVGSLDVPGATGKRTTRAKASTSQAGAKPKGARAKAKM
jgi:hypothetical protein